MTDIWQLWIRKLIASTANSRSVCTVVLRDKQLSLHVTHGIDEKNVTPKIKKTLKNVKKRDKNKKRL